MQNVEDKSCITLDLRHMISFRSIHVFALIFLQVKGSLSFCNSSLYDRVILIADIKLSKKLPQNELVYLF